MGSNFNSFNASGFNAFVDSGFNARGGGTVPLVYAAADAMFGLAADGQSIVWTYAYDAQAIAVYPSGDGTVYGAGQSSQNWGGSIHSEYACVFKVDEDEALVWNTKLDHDPDAEGALVCTDIALYGNSRVAVTARRRTINAGGYNSTTIYMLDDSDGSILWKIDTSAYSEDSLGCAFDASGNLWVVMDGATAAGGDGTNVLKYSSAGSLISSFTVTTIKFGSEVPETLGSIDVRGSLLMMSGKQVYAYTTGGSQSAITNFDNLGGYGTVKYTAEGNVAYGGPASYGGFAVNDAHTKFDTSLNQLWSEPSSASFPSAVDAAGVGADGSIFFVSYSDTARVVKYDADGNVIWTSQAGLFSTQVVSLAVRNIPQ